jgi:hypothetical protein
MFMRSHLGKALLLVAGAVVVAIGFQNCAPPGKTKYAAESAESSASNTPGVPSAPNQLSAHMVSSVEIDLSWSDNSGNESGFRIERASAVSGPFVSSGGGTFSVVATVPANTVSYHDVGLIPSTTYTYRVSAVNGSSVSAVTSSVNATTDAAPVAAPSPPSNLVATLTAATIVTVTWNDGSNNETYFRVERSLDGGKTFAASGTVSANMTSYIDANLTPTTTYTYRVRASNGAGDSTYTANASATTPAAVNTNTFSYISANILVPNCVSCHGGANPSAGISYDTYASTLKTVVARLPASSQLYTSVNSGAMPLGDGKLQPAQISAIQSWISNGALNN